MLKAYNHKMSHKPERTSATIALNKKAQHDYHLEERYEAGLVLEGWEVKSLRAGRGQLTDSYVLLKQGEAFLLGAHITPLATAVGYLHPDPTRTRKLLLNQKELNKLFGAVERKGYTLLATKLYWKKNRVKVEIALAKGKKEFDKRAALKEREWDREMQRGLKQR